MRRTHRLPARLTRWTSLWVCFALIFASQTLITQSSNGKRAVFDQQVPQDINRQPANGRGKGKRAQPAPPQAGAPAARLPNTDEVRQRRHGAARAPLHIESTIRSRRKPLESRHGRKVGDPLPPKEKKASTDSLENGSERVRIASADAHGYVGAVRSHQARTTRSLPAGADSGTSTATLLGLIDPNRGLSNHAALD